MKQTVFIEGMHCNMCSSRVIRVFSALSGVDACEVCLEEKKAILTLSEPLAEDILRETVENLGFDYLGTEQ